MTPRRLGLVVMAVALLALIVLSGLRSHTVAGTAVAASVPGPPSVGDCVIDPVERPTIAADGTGSLNQVYPRQQIHPCDGTRYGEITAVIKDPVPVIVEGTTAYQSVTDPNISSCYDANTAYVGQHTQLIADVWSPNGAALIWPALTGPSPRQKAAGQHWLACIVSVLPSLQTSTNSDAAPYRESLRDAVQNGHERNLLGYCVPTVLWDQGTQSGACGAPHVLEILAGGGTGDRAFARTDLQASCLAVVKQLTGIADPTAGGALSVRLYASTAPQNLPFTGAIVPADASVQCGVVTTGSRQLTGSLLALGDGPIPWA